MVLAPEWGEGSEMNNIHPGEHSIEQQNEISDQKRRPYVAEFKTGDEPMFRKPDHDPHGELSAMAAYSSTSCDVPGCTTTGLVATDILEDSAGLTGHLPFDIICTVCAESDHIHCP